MILWFYVCSSSSQNISWRIINSIYITISCYHFLKIGVGLSCGLFCFLGRATQHVGSLFPTRYQTCVPLHWRYRGLTTGLPGKSLNLLSLLHKSMQRFAFILQNYKLVLFLKQTQIVQKQMHNTVRLPGLQVGGASPSGKNYSSQEGLKPWQRLFRYQRGRGPSPSGVKS